MEFPGHFSVEINTSATISGTAPNQTLSLAIPQGVQGNPGVGSSILIAENGTIFSTAATTLNLSGAVDVSMVGEEANITITGSQLMQGSISASGTITVGSGLSLTSGGTLSSLGGGGSGGPVIVQSAQAANGATLSLPNPVTIGNYLLAFVSQSSALATFGGMPQMAQATDSFTATVYGQFASSTASPSAVVTGNGFIVEVSGVTNALFNLEPTLSPAGALEIQHNAVHANSALFFMTCGNPNPEGAVGIIPNSAQVLTSGFGVVGYQSYPVFVGLVQYMKVGINKIIYIANGTNPHIVSAELS